MTEERPGSGLIFSLPLINLIGSMVVVQASATEHNREYKELMRTVCIVMTAAVLGAGPCVEARTIHVNLGDNARPTLNGPAGGAGTTWNDWSLSGSGLKDSVGNDTTVNFTAAGTGPYGDWWCDLELLAGGVFDEGGGSLPIVITGLEPGKTYDLYIASSWGQKESNTSFWSVNKMDTSSSQTADNRTARNGTTWERGVNYVLFQNIEPDVSGQISLTYGGIGTYGIINGFQLLETGLAAVTFDSWASNPTQQLTAGVNDGPLDDPDQDGIVNLLEFALGGTPMVASLQVLPKLARSGGEWLFEYDRNDFSRPPGITQVVEYSNDLVTWTPVIIPSISSGNVTITDGGSFDHVKVIIPAQGTGNFARLKVSR
jgi:hypothetical protein